MVARLSVVLAAVLVFASSLFGGDVVVLKNGSMLEGTVNSMTELTLRLNFPGGESTIQRSEIKSVHFNTTAVEVNKLLNPPTPPVTPPPVGPVPPTGTPPSIPVTPPTDPLQTYATIGDLRVRVASARVGKAQLRDFFGGTKNSNDTHLILEFEIQNISQSRTMIFRGVPFGNVFTVRDGAGRNVKPTTLAFGNTLVGAANIPTNIPPNHFIRHTELFSEPKDRNQSLTVTIDGDGFGQSGSVQLTLPSWVVNW